jgi:hypothetical protein
MSKLGSKVSSSLEPLSSMEEVAASKEGLVGKGGGGVADRSQTDFVFRLPCDRDLREIRDRVHDLVFFDLFCFSASVPDSSSPSAA